MEITIDQIIISIPAWLVVIAGFVSSLIITYFSIPPIVSLARSKGFYDMPNGRTSHIQATPYLGGVAVFTGLILSTVVIVGIDFGKELTFIIAGLIILLFVGLKDDMMMINPYKKLLGQIIASGIIVFLGNIRITNFHSIFELYEIPYLSSILFSIFVFLVIINGINLIDGIDGLASGIGILISSTFGLWFLLTDHVPYSVLCFSLSGSLGAFIYFNVFSKKNKIFLGDAGSLMVGLTIAVVVIQFLEYQINASSYNIKSAPAIAFAILIVPLFDTLRVFILRIMQGRSPFSADRQHIHHVLLDLGNSHFRATIILVITNIFFIIISLSFHYLRNLHLIIIQLILASCFSYIAIYLLRRKRNKEFNKNNIEPIGKQVLLKRSDSLGYLDYEQKSFKQRKKNQFLNILNI